MPEDFGTVNVSRADRGRELDAIRQSYRHHREALQAMAADAPTEQLSSEYVRIIREIDQALLKLDDLDVNRAPGQSPTSDTIRTPLSAGERPLASAAQPPYELPVNPAPAAGARTMLIIIVGLVLLLLIGWLIWRGSSRGQQPTITEETPISATTGKVTETTVTEAAKVVPVETPASAEGLKVAPQATDYGTIRKGTRAVRQFEVTSLSNAPMEIAVSRSACRCLYYDYAPKLVAKGKGTITVTIDAAKAKAGVLDETLKATSKKDPAVNAEFKVTATIK